jgi:predicted GNAT family acetyltransferase
MQVWVRHNYKAPRFDAFVEWQGAGYLTYVIEDGYMNIEHTVVKPELRGNGIGEAQVNAAVQHAEKKGLKVKASCSYAAHKLSLPLENGKEERSCSL